MTTSADAEAVRALLDEADAAFAGDGAWHIALLMNSHSHPGEPIP